MAWGKLSRHERGYGKEWDRIRKIVLARDCGLCQCKYCKKDGLFKIATEVDHIVSKAKAATMSWTKQQIDDPLNLQAINSECHKRKTQEEQGRALKPRKVIGEDGWPV